MNNTWLMGVSAGAVFALMIGIACCPGSVMYKFPGNLILLMILSLFMGVMLGVIGATYACDSQDYDLKTGKWICITNPDGPAVNGRMSVLLAMAITIALVAVLTLFACQTKCKYIDYSSSNRQHKRDYFHLQNTDKYNLEQMTSLDMAHTSSQESSSFLSSS